MNKTDFDKKLTSFNRPSTSSKTKNLEVRKKLYSLITKDFIFTKVEFILQVMMDLKTHLFIIWFIRIKKQNKSTDYVISWKSNGVFNSTLKHLNIEWE